MAADPPGPPESSNHDRPGQRPTEPLGGPAQPPEPPPPPPASPAASCAPRPRPRRYRATPPQRPHSLRPGHPARPWRASGDAWSPRSSTGSWSGSSPPPSATCSASRAPHRHRPTARVSSSSLRERARSSWSSWSTSPTSTSAGQSIGSHGDQQRHDRKHQGDDGQSLGTRCARSVRRRCGPGRPAAAGREGLAGLVRRRARVEGRRSRLLALGHDACVLSGPAALRESWHPAAGRSPILRCRLTTTRRRRRRAAAADRRRTTAAAATSRRRRRRSCCQRTTAPPWTTDAADGSVGRHVRVAPADGIVGAPGRRGNHPGPAVHHAESHRPRRVLA